MTPPAPVSLASANTCQSIRVGNGRGRIAWPLTRHRLLSHRRASSRQGATAPLAAQPPRSRTSARPASRRSDDAVRLPRAHPACLRPPQKTGEAFEAGHCPDRVVASLVELLPAQNRAACADKDAPRGPPVYPLPLSATKRALGSEHPTHPVG